MYQLDVKNAFVYDDLTEHVLMEQPPDFIAQGKNTMSYQKGDLWSQTEPHNII